MKDITRIHLAKVAYDIETAAKKDLEKYMETLERYAGDDDIVGDVELRITELFMERGIATGGVIGVADVKAIKEQLGDPAEFSGESGDIAVGPEANEDGPRHRLYRDLDGAVLGGVLNGIARYFDINVLWPRLIFILLLFPSFGTMLLVYAVLWIVIPPAKTAAEKLELEGKPVTVTSIKELGERASAVMRDNKTAEIIKSLLLLFVNLVFIALAVGAFALTIYGGYILIYQREMVFGIASLDLLDWVMNILLIASGVFATVFFALCSYMVSKRQMEKRVLMVLKLVTAAGLVSFVIGIGALVYGNYTFNNTMYDSRTMTSTKLSGTFDGITSLAIDAASNDNRMVLVEYVVASANYRYELSSQAGMRPEFTKKDTTLTIKLTSDQPDNQRFVFQPLLRIYGPAIEGLSFINGVDVTYNGDQPKLVIDAKDSHVMLTGSFDTVSVTSDGVATVDLGGAVVRDLDANVQAGSVSAGVVRTLQLSQPEACVDSDTDNSSVTVRGVSSGTVTYNGVNKPAESVTIPCGSLTIGSRY